MENQRPHGGQASDGPNSEARDQKGEPAIATSMRSNREGKGVKEHRNTRILLDRPNVPLLRTLRAGGRVLPKLLASRPNRQRLSWRTREEDTSLKGGPFQLPVSFASVRIFATKDSVQHSDGRGNMRFLCSSVVDAVLNQAHWSLPLLEFAYLALFQLTYPDTKCRNQIKKPLWFDI